MMHNNIEGMKNEYDLFAGCKAGKKRLETVSLTSCVQASELRFLTRVSREKKKC